MKISNLNSVCHRSRTGSILPPPLHQMTQGSNPDEVVIYSALYRGPLITRNKNEQLLATHFYHVVSTSGGITNNHTVRGLMIKMSRNVVLVSVTYQRQENKLICLFSFILPIANTKIFKFLRGYSRSQEISDLNLCKNIITKSIHYYIFIYLPDAASPSFASARSIPASPVLDLNHLVDFNDIEDRLCSPVTLELVQFHHDEDNFHSYVTSGDASLHTRPVWK